MRSSALQLPRWLFPLLFFATLFAYLPALSAGFIWDDDGHVTRPDLRSLSGLFRIWFEPGATQQYYPLLHSAFWLEHKLWGDSALGYHLLNILLHAANACLFARLLTRLAIPGAAFAALLFALHPVCVESVAWISEQKNTLSTLLYLSAALAYLKFHDTRSTQLSSLNPQLSTPPSHLSPYLLSTLLFAAALLTKSVTATLPAALLVILWWRHGSLTFRRDVLPLLPWFALAALAGLHTAHFERTLIGASGEAFDLTLAQRLLLAARAPWFYLGKLLWPLDLAFVYPRWTLDPASLAQWLWLLATLTLLAFAAFVAARTSEPFRRLPPLTRRAPLAALLLFGGTLFPVLGFFNVYPFLFSYVADHFQYLATLPLFALAASAAASTSERPRSGNFPPRFRILLPAALLLLLATLTFQQTRTYRDDFTLWQTTVAQNPTAALAHHNLAVLLSQRGDSSAALSHFEQALSLRPNYAHAHANLGDLLLQLGRPADALPHLEQALRLQPNYAAAHNTLGAIFAALGRPADARTHYETALRLDPLLAAAHRNLGLAIAAEGRHADAIPHFQRATELAPHDADAALSLAIALLLTDRFAAAEPHFARAIELAPDSAAHRLAFGRALAQHNRLNEALAQFRAAVSLNPNSGDAHLALAYALRQLGRPEEAQTHFLAARRLQQ